MSEFQIKTIEELEAHYGPRPAQALVKEIDYISDHYRQYIEAAPFFALATSGKDGLDCSPRGDPAGWVQVVDERTIEFADRKGNNRLDSLRNIIHDPRVALLFLIPGVENAMRVNGRATISADPERLARHSMANKQPKSVICVHVEAIYFQRQRAIERSGLWNAHQAPALPDAIQMNEALLASPQNKR